MGSSIAESLLRNTPELIGWAAGIVLAVIMIGRGGGKAEKLLLAGCSLLFFTMLANPFVIGLVRSLTQQQDTSYRITAQTMGWATLLLGVLSLAGLICLIWAFWVRFRTRRQEAV